jgi:misacylated tRNA(Ala) deacylase
MGSMTELIYHADSYQKTFQAEVTDLDAENHGVVLTKTAFYPGGGGQPPDFGNLLYQDQAHHITRAKRIKGRIVHLLNQEAPLPAVGSTVQGNINWEHRYQLMRTHTALHVLCGVVFRDYGASVTGGNMNPLSGRMDFEFKSLNKELVKTIEDSINKEVNKGLSVTWWVLPREEAFQIPDLIRTKINLLPDHIQEVRVVEIEGLDLQADGGTHVKNTSEVGVIHIDDYKSKGAENKRIYISLE